MAGFERGPARGLLRRQRESADSIFMTALLRVGWSCTRLGDLVAIVLRRGKWCMFDGKKERVEIS